MILDDLLPTVDAYDGKYILDNCFLEGLLSNQTRILVTHSLHVLDKVDYIYVMDNAPIIEQDTYSVKFSCINETTFFLFADVIPRVYAGWPYILMYNGGLRKRSVAEEGHSERSQPRPRKKRERSSAI